MKKMTREWFKTAEGKRHLKRMQRGFRRALRERKKLKETLNSTGKEYNLIPSEPDNDMREVIAYASGRCEELLKNISESFSYNTTEFTFRVAKILQMVSNKERGGFKNRMP